MATYYPGHNNTPKKYLNAASPSSGSSHSLPSHASGGGRGAWVLWGFYAKFAERCLNDPRLALYALDKAVVAASGSFSERTRRAGANFSSSSGGGGVGDKAWSCGVALPLVARAQLCHRWPKLAEGAARTFFGRLCCGGASTPEGILLDATKR